jgi:hypothetical protein
MKCSTPPPLTDEEISAALEGELDARIQQHLDKCVYCTARLVAAQQFERTLNKQLYRLNCPQPDELSDYIVGMLADSRRRTIAHHLETCSLCQAEVTHLQSFLNPPKQEPRSNVSKKSPSPQRRFISPLRIQPSNQAGMTRSGVSRSQQKTELIAGADGVTVFLEIQQHGTEVRLTGQVMAESDVSWGGALLELRRGDQLQAAVILEDVGEFTCENIPVGEYELRVTGEEGQQLLLDTFQVG